jgi:predicted nucleic acid-binding protein
MNVLVDTSIWIDHFRSSSPVLVYLMEMDLALIHPMVLGELACGTLPNPRNQTLANIELLKPANQASLTEVMSLIAQHKLYGQGCGLIDMHLLAATAITPDAALWTYDKRLDKLANKLNISYRPNPH